MNLLRKSFLYTSISVINRPSPLAPCLSSLFYKLSPYSILTTFEYEERICTDYVIGPLTAQRRFMSTSKGRSMRSKVEKRMQRETGKTLREMRRAKKLRKKLMTDDERLFYNLRRAKKKVYLLLQKLKKYELPDLPPPRHDPELLTAEQLQAYKKIGFRNRNYVPVGVRGVFGGVVQNMHLHWKFHETVQVCCDNFPKEKIKEMATMLARLSGGIVVNVHDVKTIIMFRGRNYRQPKNLIPLNTLTKRKALFKARFEQALESQKLNIKKIEQQLRRKGINPEDPVHMASIQRVASTFFRAIDEQQGTPYVFKQEPQRDQTNKSEALEFDPKADAVGLEEDSDQEELDIFIKEIEDSADQEWEEEEAKEREEADRIRYWNREDFDKYGNSQRRLDVRKEMDEDSEDYESEDDSSGREKRGRFGHNRSSGFNKLRASRDERIDFDSGSDSDESFVKRRGVRNSEGYVDVRHGGLSGIRKRVESDSRSGDELWGSDEDFVKNEGYEDIKDNRGSGGIVVRTVKSDSSDEPWESDVDFGDKRFGLGNSDKDESADRNGYTVATDSKKNSDESWDSD
ncbi:hypothetical protein LUZ60_011613 [Juncus effusus]|nr:hypothetical protein LUZ60_011613 [Juncus effusus]